MSLNTEENEKIQHTIFNQYNYKLKMYITLQLMWFSFKWNQIICSKLFSECPNCESNTRFLVQGTSALTTELLGSTDGDTQDI